MKTKCHSHKWAFFIFLDEDFPDPPPDCLESPSKAGEKKKIKISDLMNSFHDLKTINKINNHTLLLSAVLDYANYYQAVWDCQADVPDELSFRRGDLIFILSKVCPHSVVCVCLSVFYFEGLCLKRTRIRPTAKYIICFRLCQFILYTCLWAFVIYFFLHNIKTIFRVFHSTNSPYRKETKTNAKMT